MANNLVQRDANDKRRNPYAYEGFRSIHTSCIWVRISLVLPYAKMEHTVADFGCGVGWNTKLLSLFCDRVIGIDKSQQAIEMARAKSGASNTEWLCADMSDDILPESSIDLAVSIQSLEHLDQERMRCFFANVSKALKPGSLLVGSTTEFRKGSIANASAGHRFEPGRKDFICMASPFFRVEKMRNDRMKTWDRGGINVEGFFMLRNKKR